MQGKGKGGKFLTATKPTRWVSERGDRRGVVRACSSGTWESLLGRRGGESLLGRRGGESPLAHTGVAERGVSKGRTR